MLTSSEARSPEAVFISRSEDHQELKIIRSWSVEASRAVQMI